MTERVADGTVESLLDGMTLPEKVGQLVMAVSVANNPAISDVRRLITEGKVGSLIATGHRQLSAMQIARRNNELQALAMDEGSGIPLLIGGDFEQGLASIMPLASTAFPQQMALGAVGDVRAAEEVAAAIGAEARALGLHWTFAPTADVQVNPANPVIGVRAFGEATEQVAALVAAQVRGYGTARLMATPKHFPGHGDAEVDSHRGLPTIPLSLTELERVHLPPFQAAFDAGAAAVMTAHIVFPDLDPVYPATLSHSILSDLLRDRMGYGGIVITDMMDMKAVAAHWTVEEAAVQAVLAGADIVMPGQTTAEQVRTVRALTEAADGGVIRRERLNASVGRVLRAKQEQGLLDGALVDENEAEHARMESHAALARDLFRRSIVLVRNDGTLPFSGDNGESTLVAGVSTMNVFGGPTVSHVETVAALVRRASHADVESWTAAGEEPAPAEIGEVVSRSQSVERIVVLTYARGTLPEGQARLVNALLQTGKPVAAIATSTPYDIASYPRAGAYIACFAHSFAPTHLATTAGLEAAIGVVFGQEPEGRLPVSIPGMYEAGYGLRYDRR